MQSLTQSLLSFDEQKLKEEFKLQGFKPFYARIVLSWIWQRKVTVFEKMTDLSKEMRETLARKYKLSSITSVKEVLSDDLQTTKWLWKLEDNYLVESVLIESFDRRTVCVSCQVGCPARCAFCASGKEGLMRHLSVAEIVEQILFIERFLNNRGEKVTHIVFMGMGEPLDNYDNIVQSIRLLTDAKLMGLSRRRITVSTVGVVDGINRLAEEGLGVNLVLSLHAPNQKLRQKIIPYARRYPLEEIMQAMKGYSTKTGRDVTFEYILLDGLNDQIEHAQELATLLKGWQCNVNLIPYNPVQGLRIKRPSGKQIDLFRSVLDEKGILNTCRYTKGDDIAAACGQLALQKASESSLTLL